MDALKTCQSCAHCDTDEATTHSVPGRTVRHVVVGVCTLWPSFLYGKHVPDWMCCPEYEPVTSPQGDGDSGEAA